TPIHRALRSYPLILPVTPPSPLPTTLSLTPPSTPEIYTLSLHDALPISQILESDDLSTNTIEQYIDDALTSDTLYQEVTIHDVRSEEHTSELQSRFDLVCRLLLEKKKKKE